jgi:hypothetical protein
MTDDSKALPEFVTDCGQSWLVVNDDRMATESDLSAVLAAMDPEQRQRVLVAAFGNDDTAGPVFKMMDEHHRDHHRSETKLQAELAAERAKVARLEAFFVEHGERTKSWMETAGQRRLDTRAGYDAHDALSAILATLPKGTKETP